VGGSDCEHIGQGLLAQPANTLSSLAYLVAGAMLLWRALAAGPGARVAPTVFALTVAGVGVGSGAFHGPTPGWGRFAHDLSIAAVLAFFIGYGATLARRAPVSTGLAIFGALVGASAIVLAASPDASNALVAVLVIGAAGAEVAAARSPAGRAAGYGAPWVVGGGAALAIGALLNALGRTDAPLCDPHSLVQLHAVWHVLTAFVLWCYGYAVLEPREEARRIISA
jgi:hypothetical protein